MAKSVVQTGNPTRDDWLSEALVLLGDKGLEGVTIDGLCARLNRSKGSFYWHFDGRAGLLRDMAKSWATDFTERLLEEVRDIGGSDLDQLRSVGELARERNVGNIDRAMRIWAEGDGVTLAAVKQADRRILDFSAERFRNLGMDETAARQFAELSLATSVGYYASEPSVGADIHEGLERLLRNWIASNALRPRSKRSA